jgi:glycosyltransferase involved in cell wall biosynthesis
VANVGAVPGIRSGTDLVVRRATAVIAVSDYLRRELETKLPATRGKTHVVDCGIDLERFAPLPAADGPTAYVCVGGLSERKNVLRLADAFDHVDEAATLTFVGDGPLRPQLEGRERVHLLGRVSHDRIPEVLARSHVLCQPSLVEPFGQALLEAMACERSVVATTVGGPPEFVTADAGVLVDPTSEESIADGLRRAAQLPRPNHAARAAAAAHDVNEQARRVEEILARAGRGRRGAARPAA